MAVVVRCPNCAKRISKPSDLAGTEIVCPACGRALMLPGEPKKGVAGAKGASTPDYIKPMQGEAGLATQKRGNIAMLGLGIALVLTVVVAGGGWYAFNSIKHSHDLERATKLQNDAADLMKQGQLDDARQKYAQLLILCDSDSSLTDVAEDTKGMIARIDRQIAEAAKKPAPVATNAGNPSAPQVASTSPDAHQATPAVSLAHEAVASASHNTGGTSPAPPPTTVPATQPARPPAQAVVEPATGLTDEQIGRAIQRGVDHIIATFDQQTFELKDETTPNRRPKQRDALHDGADVLCVYALMQCGEAIPDVRLSMNGQFLTGCIDAMKAFPLKDRFSTYSRGLRATALALGGRKEDRTALHDDVNSLIKVCKKGAYDYYESALNDKNDDRWDNSNSQYGLLGVWSGAEAEIEVPASYWTEVEKHWTLYQLPNGQWSYLEPAKGRPGTLTMTCAGIASMFVCHDYLDAPKFGAMVGREPFSPPLKKALDWLEQGDNCMGIGGQWGYSLYGVERCGLASGFKFFGKHNWYPELAKVILNQQRPNGSWGDVIDTSYALLFLSRGRHPILMNKVRFDGYWANRPRDVANLATYVDHELERPVNWQVVPIGAKWTDWTDSPILYLSSHVPPKIAPEDEDKIRQFVYAGGMLFVQADGDAAVMQGFAKDLAHHLFPQYELTDVPNNHPLFTSDYKISSHPPLKMITNGSRILMLFSPTDISRNWQLRNAKNPAGKPIFQLGLNMFVYAAGRRDFKNRLDSNILAAVTTPSSMSIKIARVQYAGNWDPEPYAWTRFSRWMHGQTGYALDVQNVKMRDLNAALYPFAHLTGSAPYKPTPDEIAAVKKYVESGGVLVIDNCGGTSPFDQSMNTMLLPGLGAVAPMLVQSFHPMVRNGPSGMDDLTRPQIRPYTLEKIGASGAVINYYKIGKGHVIFTSLDITSGLLNTSTWGIIGYEPKYAQHLMKNMILWTVDGQKDG